MKTNVRVDSEQRHSYFFFSLFSFFFAVLFLSCDYGQLGGADSTVAYYAGETVFTERMAFLDGAWYSHYAGIGRLDGYRICKWGGLTDADKAKIESLFPALDIVNSGNFSQADDYIVFYDDTVYGQDDNATAANGNWGFAYMGVARAINIFNNDKNRGAIIIEYFEGADPNWLWDPNVSAYQGLAKGEKPFFGIYYRVLSPDIVQMANAVDLAALYAGKTYYTEKGTLKEAVDFFNTENEAELISWGVVIPQDRE
jgi:hypothetical protein